jgi:hypothetical protein
MAGSRLVAPLVSRGGEEIRVSKIDTTIDVTIGNKRGWAGMLGLKVPHRRRSTPIRYATKPTLTDGVT